MNETVRAFPSKRRPEPFEIVYPVNWEGKQPDPIEWLVNGCLPRRAVCLFSGDSGLGKSLMMQQLMTCAAIGRKWLGFDVLRCRSFGMFCEDPLNVLHWRQRHIVQHYGTSEIDLEDMSLVSRVGLDNTLMDFNRRTDIGQETALLEQIRTHATTFGAQLIVIDTAAQVFNGNEIIRKQVTAFVSTLHKLALAVDGTVVLTSHPSDSGMASGRGTSGSGAWRASVRAHMYLKRPKGYDEDDENAGDERVLKTMKSNWGPSNGVARILWKDGVFVREGEDNEAASVGGLFERIELDAKVMAGLKYLIENGSRVSADPHARNGLANAVRNLPSCKSYSWSSIVAAQERLLAAGKIVRTEMGPPSKRFVYVRPADLRYPGEVKSEPAGETG